MSKFINRYERNGIISSEEQKLIKNKKVLVFGLGGLGGFIVEELARFGVGNITCVDFDVFSDSNLNRQIFCNEENIGEYKTDEVKKGINLINSEIKIETINKILEYDEILKVMEDKDVVIDALDNINNKLSLEKACKEKNIILIHGAIGGWQGQVATIYPNDDFLQKFYANKNVSNGSNGNTSFTPAVIASIQVSECIKVLLGKNDKTLRNNMLILDLLNNDFLVI